MSRPQKLETTELLVYLSNEPLTSADGALLLQHGHLREDLFDRLLYFPALGGGESRFAFTYLHPGEYYLTVVADLDGDEVPGSKDRSTASRRVTLEPGAHLLELVSDF